MIEDPSGGRAVIKYDYESLIVEIPVKRNWPVLLFMVVWLTGWAFGELLAIRELLSFDTPLIGNIFLLFWLAGWTIGGGFAFNMILWQLAGKEVISVGRDYLTIKKSSLGLGRRKKYETGSIKNIELIPGKNKTLPGRMGKINVPGKTGGGIKFNYGKKIVYFARDLNKREVQTVYDRMKQNPYLRSKNFASDSSRPY